MLGDIVKLKDIDLRKTLNEKFTHDHGNDPNTIVINELGLCQGISRIDIAVINGSIHGYEIKSEKDTLERLNSQIETYNKVCDAITLVTCENHKDKVTKVVPKWWGLSIAEQKKNKIQIKEIRKPRPNPLVDSYSVAQLLWRDEAIEILKEIGHERGFTSKPRKEIWFKLATCLPSDELRKHIRDRIKARKNWRSVNLPR